MRQDRRREGLEAVAALDSRHIAKRGCLVLGCHSNLGARIVCLPVEAFRILWCPPGLQDLLDLVGDCLPLAEYGTYCESRGAIGGAVSIMDGAREWDDVTDGW